MILAIPPYLLLLFAIGLIYLIDCVVLLYANEAIVELRDGRWRIEFGSRQTWVAGKRIHLLNPFTPLAATFRGTWKTTGSLPDAANSKERATDYLGYCEVLCQLRSPVAATAWVVLVVLPIAMMLWGPLGFLAGAAASWLTVVILLVRFYRIRFDLGVTGGAFGLIAFECFACPPCAVNLLRKLALRRQGKLDLLAWAALIPESKTAVLALERIREQVDACLLMAETESMEFGQLQNYRELLDSEQVRLKAKEAPSP